MMLARLLREWWDDMVPIYPADVVARNVHALLHDGDYPCPACPQPDQP